MQISVVILHTQSTKFIVRSFHVRFITIALLRTSAKPSLSHTLITNPSLRQSKVKTPLPRSI